MNYYIDTEFLEGTQTKRILGIPVGKTKPTIDLISIGIVTEDGREFYAISNDFNLKEAWNRYQTDIIEVDYGFNTKYEAKKTYWIRENVLKPIFIELCEKENIFAHGEDDYFTYSRLKHLINKYGKTNTKIADEIKQFCRHGALGINSKAPNVLWDGGRLVTRIEPVFHAYYADYDWVAFCWLFGKMIDLPDGFPMYCIDLKQMLDGLFMNQEHKYTNKTRLKAWIEDIKKNPNYPKQENEHNALDDARWNKKLHEFINKL